MDIETHLLIIADKESSPREANESITKLYEEFRGFVYNLAFKHIGFILQKEELALNVVTEVFLKIWNSPLDWEFDSNKHDTHQDGYKAYLATIAHYKLLEELRKNKPVRENETTIIDDAESEWKWALLDEDFDTLDKELIKRHNLIDSCLAELPERKRDIVRMYFFLYDDNRRMTSEKIRLMEETFETTWQNIRQIISRTKRTIEDLVKKKL